MSACPLGVMTVTQLNVMAITYTSQHAVNALIGVAQIVRFRFSRYVYSPVTLRPITERTRPHARATTVQARKV